MTDTQKTKQKLHPSSPLIYGTVEIISRFNAMLPKLENIDDQRIAEFIQSKVTFRMIQKKGKTRIELLRSESEEVNKLELAMIFNTTDPIPEALLKVYIYILYQIFTNNYSWEKKKLLTTKSIYVANETLLEAGFWPNKRSVWNDRKEVLDILTDIKIEWYLSGKPQTGAIFTLATDVSKGFLIKPNSLKDEDVPTNIDPWSVIFMFVYYFPLWAYKLKTKYAFSIAIYIYIMLRQNQKEIKKKGYLKINLCNILEQTGISIVDFKKEHNKKRKLELIEKALKEINSFLILENYKLECPNLQAPGSNYVDIVTNQALYLYVSNEEQERVIEQLIKNDKKIIKK